MTDVIAREPYYGRVVLPQRTDLDLECDRLWQCMVNTDDPALKVEYGRRFTAKCNERNAARTPQEIEQLERARGLRP